jgi:hypothetical protein
VSVLRCHCNGRLLHKSACRSAHCKYSRLACNVGLWKQLSGPKSPAAKAHALAPKQAMSGCAEYDRLSSQLDEILKKLVDTTTLQLEIFRSRKPGDFMRVDKELELLVGEKERSIGAIRQHADEHKCQAALSEAV